MRVLIIYRFLPHYRAEFYNRLREVLASRQISLDLIYGDSQADRADKVDLPWAQRRPNWSLKLGGAELLWQPCLFDTRHYDLVVVEQANRLLLNYLLLLVRRPWRFQLAYWGHGLNLLVSPRSWVNRFKLKFLGLADWWFAYTKGVGSLLQEHGYPPERISVLNNSIDMARLSSQLELAEVPRSLQGRPVALYCGGMYKEKRLDFLLDCCREISQRVPDFQMVFIGAGQERYKVQKAAQEHPWVHDLGPLVGEDVVPFLRAARVILMPGVVGLIVLDSFAAGAPLVTLDDPWKGPEIEYLESGHNGLKVADDQFVESVVELFNNQQKWEALRQGCLESAKVYSLDAMVANFAQGVEDCLKTGR